MNTIQELATSSLWKTTQATYAKEWQLPFMVLDKDANVISCSNQEDMPFLYKLLEHKAPQVDKKRVKEFLDNLERKSGVYESITGCYHLIYPLYKEGILVGALCIAAIRDNRDLSNHFMHLAQSLHLEKEELLDAYHRIQIQNFHTIQHLKKTLHILAKLFFHITQKDTESRKKIDQLQSLQEVQALFSKTMHSDELCKVLTQILQKNYQLFNTSMIFLDQKRKHYHHTDALIPYDAIENILIQQMQQSKHMMIIKNVQTDFLFENLKIEKSMSIACFPLKIEKELTSFIVLYKEQSLTNEALDQITNILGYALEAMEKATQFSSVQNEALHDPLTKLYNRSYFMQTLEKALQDTKLQNKATSLIMLDIDDFKKHNDTFGHQRGDEILEHISRIIGHTIRKEDIAARYGGEEFIVLLPQTKHDEARLVSERLRSSIGTTKITGLTITVSIGLACSLNSSSLSSELIKEADQCLYDAKKAGKNCVKSSIIVDRSLGSVQVDKADDLYVGK